MGSRIHDVLILKGWNVSEGHSYPWKWGPYVASKCPYLTAPWPSVESPDKRTASYTAAKNFELYCHLFTSPFFKNSTAFCTSFFKNFVTFCSIPNPPENSDYLRSGTGVFPCPRHLLQQYGHWPSAVNTIQSDNFKPETDVSTQQLCEQLMLHVFVYGNVSVMFTLLMAVPTSSRELQVLCVVCSVVELVNCSVN